MPSRRPPPQPLRLTNSATAPSHAPAFGKIATYSHRLPPTSRRRWSARKTLRQSPTLSETHRGLSLSSSNDRATFSVAPLRSPRSPRVRSPRSADPTEILHAIALAEVSLRGPFRQRTTPQARTTASRSQAHVTTMIEPATPQQSLPFLGKSVAVPYENATGFGAAPKQPRRNVSAPSGISLAEVELQADDALEVVRSDIDASRPTFFRPPDMTGSSGLSIAQFDAHGRSHSSSSTETLVEPVSLKAPEPLAIDCKSDDARHVPLPLRALTAADVACASSDDCRLRIGDLPRTYLCPWEEQSPQATNEKSLPAPVLATPGTFIRSVGNGRWRRKHFVTAALVVLSILVFADLVALNVRVWSMRDAYYDE